MANKRELDKEKMFQKIMPSASSAKPREDGDITPEEAAPPVKAAPSGDGGKLSDDAIAALFAQQEQPASAPEPSGDGGKLSDGAIAALFAQQQNGEGAPAPTAGTAPAIDMTPAVDTAPAGNTVPPGGPVAGPPEEAPYLINLAEALAKDNYERYQKRLDGCPCEKCRDDVLGMALNRVKPRYITSDQMDPAALADRPLITECVTALIHSIFVVKRSPKHDLADNQNR